MSSLCFVFGLGGSNGHVRIAILTSFTTLGICGWLKSLSTIMPRIISVSSNFPPTLPSTLIRSKLTSLRARSATAKTESTLILANWSLRLLTTFELNAVLAAFRNAAWLSAWMSIFRDMSVTRFTATSQAFSKPVAILRGCKPFSMSCMAWSNMEPAMTTTPVVPSPISWSCDLDRSTSNFAIWCWTSIFSKMVAPSLVTSTSPSGPTTILSMPFGPMEERIISATERAAKMFALCASIPRNRFFLLCSSTMMKGFPNSSTAS
mmetsp:Transcript_34221/g.78028  ORF Transcript_34221/g.78028 Transcript_34221/m.78028 type:complete len:263 (+) Transcript_34221:995-1783(+)